MKIIILLFSLLSATLCFGQDQKSKKQDEIISEFLTNCAQKYNYNTRMSDWQECLDNGLAKDSTIAYLWQQKAMPYFKARKYEIAAPFLDKAVFYDAKRWQSYRGFMKCIFSKKYNDAILDLEDCKKKFGNEYVMDHTLDFYIALSCLQLDQFQKAETLLQGYVNEIFQKRDGLEHPTAFFYLGIAKFELKKIDEALIEFENALELYPNFSDAKFYKAICLVRKEKKEEAKILLKESEADYKLGYKLNEDNTVYETYPYQKKWNQ